MTNNPQINPIPNQEIPNPEISPENQVDNQDKENIDSLPNPQTKIKTPSQNLGLLFSVMLFLLMIGQILGFYQLTQEVIKRQDASIKMLQQQSGSKQISQLESRYQDKLAIINQAFPQDDQIPEIINMINNRLSIFPEYQLRFDTNTSVTNQSDKFPYLPVTITFTTSRIEDVTKLIDDLTMGGIVFAPQDINLAIKSEPEPSVKVIIKAKLYVQSNQK